MSIKANNKIETNKYELEVAVDVEKFEAALQSAYMKARKNITISGFRKGKAPRKMVEKLYGEEVFFEDAVNILLPEELGAAIEEANLDVIDRPDVEVTSISKADGVVFKAICTVKPDVEVSNYLGIEAKKVVNAVTDEDINSQIEKVREKNSRLITIEDRAAQNGDETVIDFEGFVDGVAFEGGKAENFNLTLGSGQFIPGFEEQVAGHNIDEEFEINVSFPEDYAMKDIAGKPAMFKIKLHEIKVKEMPEVDDEFVKDATEFDTLDAWKEDIKTKLSEYNEKSATAEVENKIFDTVIDNTKGEIPEVMFNNRIDEMVQEFAQRLQAQGMNLDLYLQYTGMDLDGFKKTYEDRAKKEVTLRLALEKIAKLENVEVSDDDVENEFKSMSEKYKMDVEQIKSFVTPNALKLDLQVAKVAELVKNSAKITD